MTIGRWLTISLTCMACAQAAPAQAKPFSFEEAAAQIVEWSYGDCRPEKIPPPVKGKTSSTGRPWWPFSGGAEDDKGPSGPRPTPKVVNAGFHSSTTKLSESARQLIIIKIEQALSQARTEDGRGIAVRNPSDAGVNYDYIHDAFGGARSSEVASLLEAAHFDFVMRAVGVYARGNTVVNVHFLLDTPGGGCTKRTFDIEIPASWLTPEDAPPKAILEQSVVDLFKENEAGKAVKRIAILPPTVESVVLGDEASQVLTQALVQALRQGAQPESRAVGAVSKKAEAMPIANLGSGEFLEGGTRAGDWMAQIRIIPQQAETQLAVDFFDISTAAVSSTIGRIDPKYMPKVVEPLISFVKDQLKLKVGKDPVQFQVKVRKPAALLCLTQEADGESLLLFPNSKQRGLSGLQLMQPRADPYVYPKGLQAELEPENMTVATAFTLRCLTTEHWPLDMDQWWLQTPVMRHGRDLSQLSVKGADFFKMWSSLRKTAGAREILSVVHVTKGE